MGLLQKVVGLDPFLDQKWSCAHQFCSVFDQFWSFLIPFDPFWINFGPFLGPDDLGCLILAHFWFTSKFPRCARNHDFGKKVDFFGVQKGGPFPTGEPKNVMFFAHSKRRDPIFDPFLTHFSQFFELHPLVRYTFLNKIDPKNF
jgi:hypothetical protein